MKLLPAIVAIWSVSLPALGVESCLHYEGAPVALTGKVTLQTFYGPPNYGETPDVDSHETQPILILDTPICVEENSVNDEDKESTQRNVTLVAPQGVDFSAYIGQTITAKGTLFHAQTGHHHIPVLMQVTKVGGASE